MFGGAHAACELAAEVQREQRELPGIAPRHLRTFRTATNREVTLLEQLVAPALRSRNAERRAAGLRDLQSLAELAQELSGLLFWRDLREVAEQ